MILNKVIVPSGSALIGSSTPSESPQISIEVPAFEITINQITNHEFNLFMQTDGYSKSQYWSKEGWAWINEQKIVKPAFWDNTRYNQPNQPVTGVSFYESEAFSRWVGGRLPTETEWEKAARGIQGNKYPWGDDTPTLEIANYSPDFVPVEISAVNVDQYPNNKSSFGCQQMAGNLFEWCVDFFHTDTPTQRHKSFIVENRPSRRRVLKGGAWTTDISRLCCAARWSYTPNLRDNIIGLRVAFDI